MGDSSQPDDLLLPMGTDYCRIKSTRKYLIPVKVEHGEVFPLEYHGSAHINAYTMANGISMMDIGETSLEKGKSLMLDRYNRNISYLRISITDRCNLRCLYCMPEEGISLMDHQDILSYEEIMEVVREGVRLGITKVRITGGEPLVRKGLPVLLR